MLQTVTRENKQDSHLTSETCLPKLFGTLYKFGILLAQYSLATTVHNSNDKHKTVCIARMDTQDKSISSSVCGWSHIFYRK